MRIQTMMKIRDRLFQKFKSTKSTDDLKAFKQFRNRVVNELRERVRKIIIIISLKKIRIT